MYWALAAASSDIKALCSAQCYAQATAPSPASLRLKARLTALRLLVSTLSIGGLLDVVKAI